MKISSLFKPLSFLPALALMYMIYSFSAQPANSSSSSSYYISKKLVSAVNTVSGQGWDDWQIEQYAAKIHGPVRKLAHITEYFLLAVAVSFPLYVYGVRGILLMLLAGVICVGYACADEYHQSLVSGRSASFRDVAIDSIGILIGVVLTRLIGWSGRMAITGPAYERRQKKQQKELDAREEELLRREEELRRQEAYYRSNPPMRRRLRGSVPSYSPSPDYPYSAGGRNQAPQNYSGSAGGRNQVPPEHPGLAGDRNQTPQNYSGSAGVGNQVPPEHPGFAGDRNRSVQNYPGSDSDRNPPYAPARNASDDSLQRTRVIGTRHEVDDRTRVYRTQEEQRKMEEAYRSQVYERRKVQSPELSQDSTSDQLSEDLPFSGLFRKKG